MSVENRDASPIGEAVRRVEDLPLITGRGRYAADLVLPNLSHLAVFRSPSPHARIVELELDAVRQAPGVLAVWTAGDLPELAPGMADRGAFGFPVHARQVLADRIVRFQGEAIAAVVAETPYQAADAVDLIYADLEPLPAAGTLDVALDAGIPPIHEGETSNVIGTTEMGFGDVEAAFSGAPVIASGSLRLPRIAGGYLEPRNVTAAPDGDGVVVWASTQSVFGVRRQIARLLDLPAEQVRVVAHDVGGGFGPKGDVYPEQVLVAAAARRLGRPVRWVAARTEDTAITALGHGCAAEMEIAAEADGRLRGLRGRLTHDAGAYTATGTGQPRNYSTHLVSAYRLPALAVEARVVHTTTVPGGFVRGGGREVGNLVMERMMDRLADAVGCSREEIRRRNLVQPDDMPYATGLEGTIYDGGDYPRLLGLVDEALAGTPTGRRADGRLVGRALVCCVESTGAGTNEPARARLDREGRAVLYVGSTPHGQGHLTMAAQMFAARLGWPMDRITVLAGDTSLLEGGGMTAGSRSAVQVGNVSAIVGRELRSRLLELGGERLEVDPSDLQLADGVIQVRGVPARACPVSEVVPDQGLQVAGSFSLDGAATFSSSCHGAVAAVDEATGDVRVERYVIANDSGRVINPMTLQGQLHGGFAHGLGYALLEEARYGADGAFLTPSFLDYAIASPAEVPVPELHEVHTQDTASNAESIKGVGESGTLPVMAAISSAVEQAVRIVNPEAVVSELPLTPERVLGLLGAGSG
ncbi:MAG: xanthine dehydrogenase family protein molybdopterin-binding subunit [Candidatus Dormibacteraceae bacterium]